MLKDRCFFKHFKKCIAVVFSILFFIFNSNASESLSYSGRLVQTNGAPVAGPVDLKVELAYTNATGTILCSQNFTGVVLSNGVFHLKLDLACGNPPTFAEVLAAVPAGESAAIKVTDLTHSKPYSFQAMHSMPFANISETAKQLVQMGASDNQILKWNDTTKKWEPGNPGGGGTVTTVSGTLPISVATGTSTPVISISQATTTTNGYLSSADWNTFNSKQGSIAAGTTAQYYRGDKTWVTLDTDAVPEGSKLYFTNALALGVPLTSFAVGAGAITNTDTVIGAFGKAQGQIDTLNTASANYLIKNSSDTISGTVNVNATGVLTITNAPALLTDAANKQYVDTSDALKVNIAGDTMSGVLTLDSDLKIKGGTNYVTLKGHATSNAYDLILPQTAGTSGYVLKTDGAGNLSWIDPASIAAGSGTVTSASIVDGTIVDADINATAAIAQSKIANLTTDLAGKISSTLADGNILIGNASNVANAHLVSGDATLSNAGVITLKNTGTAGTYTSVTTDTQGRVTGGTNPTTLAGYGIVDTSANLAAAISDETGTGALVFANDPVIGNITPAANFTLTQNAIVPFASEGAGAVANTLYLKAGNVGIGTAVPATPLDIQQVDASNGVRIRHNGFPASQYLNVFETAGGSIINSVGAGASNGLVFQFDNSEKMRFTKEGNVGIGTTAPGSTLDVKGALRLTGATSGYVGFAPAATAGTTTYLLPTTQGLAGQVLTTDGTATTPTLSWTTVATGGTTLVGDVGGTLGANTIGAGKVTLTHLSATGTKDNTTYLRGDNTWSSLQTDVQALVLSAYTLGTNAVVAATDSVVTAFGKLQKQITDLAISAVGGDLTGTLPNPTIAKLQGGTLTIAAPATKDVLKYNGSAWVNSQIAASDLSATGTTDATTYLAGDNTWKNFNTNVIAAPLTGLSSTSGTIASTDTILAAFNKLLFTQGDYVSKTADQTIFGSLAVNSTTGFITVPTPINPNDAANKGYVDGFGQWTKGASSSINYTAGNVGIGTAAPSTALQVNGTITANAISIPGMQSNYLTRTLPTVVGDEVDIGSYTLNSSGQTFLISLTVSTSGYSQSKIYQVTANYAMGGAGVWNEVMPISSTGAYAGLDSTLDAMSTPATQTLSLRIRRTAGTVAGTGIVNIQNLGFSSSVFTASTATSSVTAPTAYWPTTVITQTAGNVGIGTTSPQAQLDVSGVNSSIKITGTNISQLAFLSPGSFANINTYNDGTLRFQSSSTALNSNANQFVLASSGNVGIGTTAPSTKLHVVDGTGELKFQNVSQANLVVTGTNASMILNSIGGTAPVIAIQNAGSTNALISADSTGFGIATSWTGPQFEILKNGNVGIGTTTPGSALDVKGTLRLSGATSGYVGFAPAADAGSTTYTLPTTQGSAGQVLTTDGVATTPTLSWVTPAASPVSSVFGRTGAVVSANGDYTATQITNTPAGNIAAATVQAALAELDGEKQGIDATLTSLAAYNTNGIMVQTAADTFVGRSIAGTSNRVEVTNADGVAGNPTINIPTALLPSPLVGDTGKFLKATAADTSVWTALGLSDITTALGYTPVNKAGDSFTTQTFAFSGTAALTVQDPVNVLDAANKQYVDGFGQWTKSGSDIYRASGNVGIGTAAPAAQLHISSHPTYNQQTISNAAAIISYESANNNGVVIHRSSNTDGTGPGLQFAYQYGSGANIPSNNLRLGTINFSGYSASNTSYLDGASIIAAPTGAWTSNNAPAYLAFSTNGGAAAPSERMRIASSGNIGIGTTAPGYQLESGQIGIKNASAAKLFLESTGGTKTWQIANHSKVVSGIDITNTTDNITALSILPGGNVGIGTTTPGSPLDVKGTLRLSGSTSGYVGFAPAATAGSTTYLLPITQGSAGQVLTTDGVATTPTLSWTTPAASPVTSVFGRTGAVVSANGDYTATQITNTPAGNIAAATVQAALAELDGEKQGIDATLTSLAAYNTNGIMVQTAADTFVGRSIAGTSNRVEVTNADGVAGNPTINIPTALLPSPVGGDAGKFLKATAADTSVWTALGLSDITTALGYTPVNKAGDSFTTQTFAFSGTAALTVQDPVNVLDVVNKQYVDGFGQWTKSGSDIYRSSGNVGIGVSVPLAKLDIADSVASSFPATSGVTQTGGVTRLRHGDSGAILDTGINGASGVWLQATHYTNLANTYPLLLNPNGGNVGIGTTTPQSKLDIRPIDWIANASGGIYLSDTGSHWPSGIYLRSDSGGIPRLDFDAPGVTSTMSLSSAGKVGIGTTTPTTALQVNANSNAGSNGILVYSNSTSATSPYIEVRGRRSDGNSAQAFSGGLALAALRTDAAVAANKSVGTIYFGGNHTDGTEANLLYTASISGVAEGTFSNSTTMPSGLAFYSGSTGNALGTTGIAYGTERMRISNTGNVGIGTASPGALLDVAGSLTGGVLPNFPAIRVSNTSAIQGDGATTFNYADLRAIAGNGAVAGSLLAAYNSGGISNGIYLRSTTNTPLYLQTNAATRMTVDSSGNVGIGTTNPTAPLTVLKSGSSGLPATSGTTQSGVVNRFSVSDGGAVMDFGIQGVATGKSWIQATDSGNLALTYPLLLNPNGGDVGIGTTAPAAKLDISDATVNVVARIGSVAAGTSAQLNLNSAAAGYPHILFTQAGTGRFEMGQVASNGNFYFNNNTQTGETNAAMVISKTDYVGIGTVNPGYKLDVQGGGVNTSGVYTNVSDIRLKQEIEPLENSLEKILQLRSVSYYWKDQSFDSSKQVGFIAQEVEKVFPEVVKTDSKGFKAMSYSQLVSPVVDAIKELYGEFKSLVARVMSLEGKDAVKDRAIASLKAETNARANKLEAENAAKDKKINKLEQENAAIKAYICSKDPKAVICK